MLRKYLNYFYYFAYILFVLALIFFGFSASFTCFGLLFLIRGIIGLIDNAVYTGKIFFDSAELKYRKEFIPGKILNLIICIVGILLFVSGF